jgi:integrase
VPESGGYVFSAPDDPFEPLQPFQWTRLIQAMFKRHSGVALAPKDLRSSHVTWLKTGEHDDATLRAAAQAMRHSSKTQDSAAYNKGKSDRLVQQAVDAAAAFASKFTPSDEGGMFQRSENLKQREA